jgi:hypothetical protein
MNVTVPCDNNGEHVTAIESLVSNEDSPGSTITANLPIESRWLPAPSVAEQVAPISFVDKEHASLQSEYISDTTPNNFYSCKLPRIRPAFTHQYLTRPRKNA